MLDLDRSSRNRLTRFNIRFFEGESLFARLGRAVCDAECLPRKEFFETWEVARRIRRRVGRKPVFELAAGHGLLAALLTILDAAPLATCVDRTKPLSHDKLLARLTRAWPRIEGRVTYQEQTIEETELPADCLVVSVHACGTLTDTVLERAVAARASVAVLPCCHDLSESDDAGLGGWMNGTLAIDAARAGRLSAAGYRVFTTTIPEDITPRNRLLIGSREFL